MDVFVLWQHLSRGPEACFEQNDKVAAFLETLRFKGSASLGGANLYTVN